MDSPVSVVRFARCEAIERISLADEQPNPAAEAEPSPEPAKGVAWGSLWQAPVIIGSLIAIGWGIYSIQSRRPQDDFDGALTQVEEMIHVGEFDAASDRLVNGIEPNLIRASQEQTARFHAALADWMFLAPTPTGKPDAKRYADIDQQYGKAVELGLALTPDRLEHWGVAQLQLGNTAGANQRLAELATLAAGAGGDEARHRRSALFRKIVDHAIAHGGGAAEELMRMLGEYRAEPGLPVHDEAWIVARQAELRLEEGKPEEAINRLLVDMRRIEPRLGTDSNVDLGELYALLGRAYYASGDEGAAERQLRHALKLFHGPEIPRGAALSLIGQLELGRGELDQARQTFETVVTDFTATPAMIGGLLGRAEALGASGEHAKAMADYQEVIDLLERNGPTAEVDASRAAQSLVDRHDAAMAIGDNDVALEYVILAEKLFPMAELPTSVLFRIASTSRLLAEDVLKEAAQGRDLHSLSAKEIDPGVREQANRHFKRAADYYVRHARASAARVEDGSEWADSLWMAADSYDLAGWHDQAIEFFKQYVSGRPTDDPRRAEARFRLAQAYHAQLDYGAAASAYADVISDHPLSPFAAQSHVPEAQCLAALGKADEAIDRLVQVLDGAQNLKPDSGEYRAAVLQYADLLFGKGEFARAIEQYDRGLKWSAGTAREPSVRFRLAESYRGLARTLDEEAQTPSLTPSEREELHERRQEALTAALGLFDDVVAALERGDHRKLDAAQQAELRMAMMYRADSAFDTGDYDRAIQLYEQAERQYAGHPVSLLALVQIVNAHHALGQTEKARTAHRRAQIRLSQLPDEAFAGPESVFDRATWERWLANSPVELSLANEPKEHHP
jgi:tetratricopeptide (TPR) repeat protein